MILVKWQSSLTCALAALRDPVQVLWARPRPLLLQGALAQSQLMLEPVLARMLMHMPTLLDIL